MTIWIRTKADGINYNFKKVKHFLPILVVNTRKILNSLLARKVRQIEFEEKKL